MVDDYPPPPLDKMDLKTKRQKYECTFTGITDTNTISKTKIRRRSSQQRKVKEKKIS